MVDERLPRLGGLSLPQQLLEHSQAKHGALIALLTLA